MPCLLRATRFLQVAARRRLLLRRRDPRLFTRNSVELPKTAPSHPRRGPVLRCFSAVVWISRKSLGIANGKPGYVGNGPRASASLRTTLQRKRGAAMPGKSAHVKNEKQYEALKDKG